MAKHPVMAAGMALFTLAWLTAALLAMLVTVSVLTASRGEGFAAPARFLPVHVDRWALGRGLAVVALVSGGADSANHIGRITIGTEPEALALVEASKSLLDGSKS